MKFIDARPVDPRDATWEVWNPAYRVYFWSRRDDGWESRVFEINDADVDAVLGWVEENDADAETFTLFAVIDEQGGLGLVHLGGSDPTRSS